MKKKLNLLCVAIFCVLALTLAESFYAMIWGAKEGFKAAMVESKEKKTFRVTEHLSALSIFPNGLYESNDSVYNAKTQENIPVWHVSSMVSIPTHTPLWLKILRILASFTIVFYGIKAIIWFIRLIKAINRSDIFSWNNVRMLRKLGMALLIIFACNLIFNCIDTFSLKQVLEIPGYSYNLLSLFSDHTLLLGVISFIVAEIFAIGLKMKEEQDLTI